MESQEAFEDCSITFLILQQDAWTLGAPFPAPFAKPESIFCSLGMDLVLQRVPPLPGTKKDKILIKRSSQMGLFLAGLSEG